MKICGVYQILNNVSGRCYVGQSCNIEKRLKDHFKVLREGRHGNRYLQRAFNKYGEQVFSTRILTRCAPEFLTQVEQGWMERFKQDRYNSAPAAESVLGYKFTAKQKEKISSARTGYKMSEEVRIKMIGRKLTEEHKAKISASLLGNTRTLGYKYPEERKAKMTGRKLTSEHKARISAANQGKHRNLGYRHTEEAKEKISLAAKKQWKIYKEIRDGK